MENKVKCVISETGIIIPIHNIALINPYTHCIWSNAVVRSFNLGHKLSDEQYDALLREIEIIEDKY